MSIALIRHLFILVLLFFSRGGLARMLRQNNIGIQQISIASSSSSGLSPPSVPVPVGNTSPAPLTTVSPFSTYQATLKGGGASLMNWTPDPNAFAFDISGIQALRAVNLGSNFKVLMTAQPVYPVPTINVR